MDACNLFPEASIAAPVSVTGPLTPVGAVTETVNGAVFTTCGTAVGGINHADASFNDVAGPGWIVTETVWPATIKLLGGGLLIRIEGLDLEYSGLFKSTPPTAIIAKTANTVIKTCVLITFQNGLNTVE